jgi:hypothetical protein
MNDQERRMDNPIIWEYIPDEDLIPKATIHLQMCLTDIKRTERIQKSVYEYYKDLPNAAEWHQYFSKLFEVSLVDLRNQQRSLETLIEDIRDRTKGYRFKYYEVTCNLYHYNDFIQFSDLKDCTILISGIVKKVAFDFNHYGISRSPDDLLRLLLSRPEAFLYDDLFSILHEIDSSSDFSRANTDVLQIIEDAVTSRLR